MTVVPQGTERDTFLRRHDPSFSALPISCVLLPWQRMSFTSRAIGIGYLMPVCVWIFPAMVFSWCHEWWCFIRLNEILTPPPPLSLLFDWDHLPFIGSVAY